MTTTASGRKATSACNGVTTVFPVPFKFQAGGLLVYLLDSATAANASGTELAEGSDFTIVIDSAGDASIVTTATYPTGKYIRRYRQTTRAQLADYTANDGFPAETHEAQLDRGALVDEEIEDDLSSLSLRAVKVPEGVVAGEIPDPAANAGKVLVALPGGGFAWVNQGGADSALRTDLATSVSAAALIAVRLTVPDADPVDSNLLAVLDGDLTYSVLHHIPRALYMGILAGTEVDVTTYVQEAAVAALAMGRVLTFPQGTFTITEPILLRPDDFSSMASTAFAPGPRVRGAGPLSTIIDAQITDGAAFDFDSDNPHTLTLQGMLRVEIEDLTITCLDSGITGTTGIKLRTAFHYTIRNVHIHGLGADAINIVCTVGDLDGSVHGLIDNCRITACRGWAISAAGGITPPGQNEISDLRIINTQWESCGTVSYKGISGVTLGNPTIITCPSHGFANGTSVRLDGIAGTTALNHQRATVTVINGNQFSVPIDSTAYGAYSAGGHAYPALPTSGGIRAKNQLMMIQGGGGTVNENVTIWFEGGIGLGQDCVVDNVTLENCGLVGVLVTGIFGLSVRNGHIYGNVNVSGPAYYGALLDGSVNSISRVKFEDVTVRVNSSVTHWDAFHGTGSFFEKRNCRVYPNFKSYDYNANQRRIVGFEFDGVPMQGRLRVVSSSEVRYEQYGIGNKYPLRMRGPIEGLVASSTGAWVERELNAAVGVRKTGIAGLTASTIHYVYLYDDANVDKMEIVTDAPVVDADTGYKVKTGDATRTYVGRVMSTAGGLVETAGINWTNARYDPFSGWYDWKDATGAARHKATEPTSDLDGALV